MHRTAIALCAGLVCGASSSAAADDLTLADLFPTDRVLDVQITVAKSDWDTIRHQTRNIFEVLHEKRQFEVIDNPYTYVSARVSIDGVDFGEVGVRKKGFIGSQSSSRPSLKIKLNHVDKKGAVEGLTNLTFNNNNQDVSIVSQFMGYGMFTAVGCPAPRCAFANVVVNGKSLGVYSHVESFRKPLMARLFGNDEGILFEGTVVDFHDGWVDSFERKFGKEKTGRRKIQQLIDALQRDTDDDLERRIAEHVDLNSFYRYWAVEGLLGFWDGYSGNRNNFFVYLNPVTDKLHFLPWGADAVFDKYSPLEYIREAPISVKTTGLVAHKLYQIEECRDRYSDTMRQLLDEHWDEEELLGEVDRIEAMLDPHLIFAQKSLPVGLWKVRKFVESRREEILEEIEDGMPVWTRVPDPPPVIEGGSGQDPGSIWSLAKGGDLDGIRELLGEGVDVNARDESGSTPLSMAAVAGQTDAIALLMKEGADLDGRDNEGNAALHGAAFFGQVDTTRLLITFRADLNARNVKGETPLDSSVGEWSAELRGIVEFIAGIMQLKIDLDEVPARRLEVARLLQRNGAKLGKDLPRTARQDLWGMAKDGDTRGLKKSLAKDESRVDAHDSNGITALAWAAMAGEVGAAKLLIEAGADVDAKNSDGGTALHSAAYLGQVEIVELLLEHEVSINARDESGETAYGLVASPWSGEIKGILDFLAGALQLPIDPDRVKSARPKIAALLLEHGGKS